MKKLLLTLCALLSLMALPLHSEDTATEELFGDLVPAGDGWYYDDVLGFVYPLGLPWVYAYSLDSALAVTGQDIHNDIYYTWDEHLGWGYISGETTAWIYYYDTDGTNPDLDSVKEGWYYSFGIASGGLAPYTYYSDSLGATVSTQLTIEIVNGTTQAAQADQRVANADIDIMLYGSGGSFSPSGISLNKSMKFTDHNAGTDTFTFSTTNFQSGRIFVSFHGAMPAEQSALDPFSKSLARNDKIEITYGLSGGVPGGSANLTAVDYFGIPMQIETLDAQNNVLQTFTFFDNTDTVIGHLEAIDAKITSDAKITDSHGAFLRVLSPKEWSGTASAQPDYTGKNPYPSMTPYLTSVSGQTVNIVGNFDGNPSAGYPAATYNYSGTLSDTGTITLTGTTSPGDSKTITIQASDLEIGIYTANPPYEVGGQSSNIGVNDVYAAVVRDLLTGFNGGYIGGTYSSDPSNNWWDKPPFQTQDGHKYYNQYAAVIQNTSQAYGFPFSDRMRTQLANFNSSVATLRITILPDDILNAPVARVTASTDSSITLAWDKIAGANDYEITHTPPQSGTTVSTGNVDTYTVSGLEPGTPYNFEVRAKNGSRLSSAFPVTGKTSGSAALVTGPGQWQASLTFLPSQVQAGDTVTINGLTATIDSSNGQVSFSNGQVLFYTVNSGGSYTGTPEVVLTGGDGVNASANVTMNAGAVGAVTFDNAGFGYKTAPTVSFSGGGQQTAASVTAGLQTTTQATIPVAAPLNSSNTYNLSWKRQDGTPVFETVFHVGTLGYETPSAPNPQGALVKVSTDSSKTYVAGNQHPASFSSASPWVVFVLIEPN